MTYCTLCNKSLYTEPRDSKECWRCETMMGRARIAFSPEQIELIKEMVHVLVDKKIEEQLRLLLP